MTPNLTHCISVWGLVGLLAACRPAGDKVSTSAATSSSSANPSTSGDSSASTTTTASSSDAASGTASGTSSATEASSTTTTASSSDAASGTASGTSSATEATTGSSGRAPHVEITTSLGSVIVEIYTDEAPITATNFLRYVDESRYQNASFYRTVTSENQPTDTVKIEVIQGGLGSDVSNMLPPIVHETTEQTGILHLDGTISMARAQVGTATSEFFICVGDQPELDFGGGRNPDGQGFAAFGRVVQGVDVVRAIHQAPADGQTLTPAVPIESILRTDL